MENKNKFDFQEELMERAYEKWQDDKEMSYFEFLLSLEPVERSAVILGNLYYQVCNGGFVQWKDNGYQEDGRNFLLLINKNLNKNKYPELSRALEMALDYGDDCDEKREDKLCSEFYNLEKLPEEMESYLKELDSNK
jgi:hypothetical protein